MSKEAIPEVRLSIQDLEAAWDRKWMDTLKDTPLVSFLSDDPVSRWHRSIRAAARLHSLNFLSAPSGSGLPLTDGSSVFRTGGRGERERLLPVPCDAAQ